jgi:hypothetical protein
MKLQIIEEPQLAFHQNEVHIDIRAGLSTFGAFDKGSVSVPVPIRLGVIGTTATVDGVRDWLEQCKNGVASDEQKLTALRPAFPGMTQQVFGTSLELSDAATRTITRHELTAALGHSEPLRHLVDAFMDHARDLAAKSGLHVLVVAPPPEVLRWETRRGPRLIRPSTSCRSPLRSRARPRPQR